MHGMYMTQNKVATVDEECESDDNEYILIQYFGEDNDFFLEEDINNVLTTFLMLIYLLAFILIKLLQKGIIRIYLVKKIVKMETMFHLILSLPQMLESSCL